MSVACIVQARMASTRLPGKVLKDIDGHTMLERVVRRAAASKKISKLIVAIPDNSGDVAILNECNRLRVDCFRGSELDVLDRYYNAWRVFGGETVVRITSDCPLIAPEIIDRVIDEFEVHQVDYASNALKMNNTRGFDVEVLKANALERAWHAATQPHERVHVTPFIYQNPGLFKLLHVPCEIGHYSFRLTVDTPEDFELILAICRAFPGRVDFTAKEIVEFLARNPEMATRNAHVRQKRLEEL